MNELVALADGNFSGFHGLAECVVPTADLELGPPLEEELHGGMFGGEPTQFRRYPATTAAPRGITCWILGDLIVGVEIAEAQPSAAALADLDEPEAVLSSELGDAWSQEVWASRGLVVHRRDDQIKVAFGLAPFELSQWEEDPLRWWRIERIRR